MSKILITDDNSDYRAGVIDFLKLEGYEVLEAENGVVALKLMRDQAPDLVFCDLDMPMMTGLELLLIVKADEALKSIPFIIVTGNRDSQLLATDADAVLYKPIKIDVLLETLIRFLPL